MGITYEEFEERLDKWRQDIGMTPQVTSWEKQDEKLMEEMEEAAKELVDCKVCELNSIALGGPDINTELDLPCEFLGALYCLGVDQEKIFEEVIEKLESRVRTGKWVDGLYVKEEDLDGKQGV